MVHILGRVRVEELARFIAVFATRGAQMRRKHGCLGSEVYKVADDDGGILVLLRWESRESFEAFLSDPAVKETMRSGGAISPPEFTYLEKVAAFPT